MHTKSVAYMQRINLINVGYKLILISKLIHEYDIAYTYTYCVYV